MESSAQRTYFIPAMSWSIAPASAHDVTWNESGLECLLWLWVKPSVFPRCLQINAPYPFRTDTKSPVAFGKAPGSMHSKTWLASQAAILDQERRRNDVAYCGLMSNFRIPDLRALVKTFADGNLNPHCDCWTPTHAASLTFLTHHQYA